jgi:hypothetical protein
MIPSLVMMYGVSIYNWRRQVNKPITFNELVKMDLDAFFKKINKDFKVYGIEWATIDGHYWIELRLSEPLHGVVEEKHAESNAGSGLKKSLTMKLQHYINYADL